MTTPPIRRILVISFNFPRHPSHRRSPGGFVADFCTELTNLGHVVSVLVPNHSDDITQAPFPGLQIERFSWSGHLPRDDERVLFKPGRVLALTNFFRNGLEIARQETMRLRPHLVVAVGTFSCGVFARGIHSLFGNPYIVWAQRGDLQHHYRTGRRNAIQSILKQAERCTAAGPHLQTQIQNITQEPVSFWPASETLQHQPNLNARLNRPIRSFLYAGRLEEAFGPDLLLDAFALALPHIPNARLTIQGHGALLSSIERTLSKQPLLAQYVSLVPELDSKAFYDQLSSHDALVVPTRSNQLPRVFNEAVQHGLPIIASDRADVPALTQRVPSAELFPSNSREDLADALWRAYHRGFSPSFDDLQGAAQLFSTHTAVNGVLETLQDLEDRGALLK